MDQIPKKQIFPLSICGPQIMNWLLVCLTKSMLLEGFMLLLVFEILCFFKLESVGINFFKFICELMHLSSND